METVTKKFLFIIEYVRGYDVSESSIEIEISVDIDIYNDPDRLERYLLYSDVVSLSCYDTIKSIYEINKCIH